MPNRYLNYAGHKYFLNKEGEARLNRTLNSVYGDQAQRHQWLTLYPDTSTPCSLLIAQGVPISIETELCIDD
ncbi:hypothetical protein GOEFS_018_00730 [Gordonia effusa NBRC 100432]|uniref:Uncharacterized protein n=1 Tax=Gordonia effusa NBRC 100432 TaxID=1077974 RepID=H0QW40_9ACTN|nr:hypothetical protein [Gordonia effusa]GAB17041.1 hypothetical protein GOEFS_018_00730 [Gordonia effusa NBRC 100432]